MELSKEYQQQLKKGLDLVNFDVFRILPQKPNVAAVILRSKHPDREHLWCVQYLGTGHYFSSYAEAVDYCKNRRWNYPATQKNR